MTSRIARCIPALTLAMLALTVTLSASPVILSASPVILSAAKDPGTAPLAYVGAADAQQTARIASVTLAPDVATVGDRLTLTIEVDHADDTVVEGPGFGAPFGGLEIVEIAPPLTADHDSERRTTLTYTLTSFATGEITVPPLNVTWRVAGDEGTLATPPQTVRIDSVLAPGDDTLRPLKPQLDLEDPAPSPLYPAMYVAVFAALTAFGYWLIARAINARPSPAGAPPPAPLLPHEAARRDLDALAASSDAVADPSRYYAAVATTLRRYLSARFAFPAYAMTRRELQRDMTRAGIERWQARLTANLLEQCDAVQFAGFRPAPERTDADLTAAYEIIDLTAPSPPPGDEPER